MKKVIKYTIASGMWDICSDIIYDNQEQAVSEASENGVKAFKFEWDGNNAQTMTNIQEL